MPHTESSVAIPPSSYAGLLYASLSSPPSRAVKENSLSMMSFLYAAAAMAAMRRRMT